MATTEPLKRSKTVWLRGSVRVRCAHCGWLMIRSDKAFTAKDKDRGTPGTSTHIDCPKCKIKTYAVVPPYKYTLNWPHCMYDGTEDENWFEKGLELIRETNR